MKLRKILVVVALAVATITLPVGAQTECTTAQYGNQLCEACWVYTLYGWVFSGVTWTYQ